MDASGNVYVADGTNHRIRKITPAQVVTTLAGSGAPSFADGTGAAAAFNIPLGITVDATGNLYVGDQMNHRIRFVTPSGVVSTLAGTGAAAFADGASGVAQFNRPAFLVRDGAGNIFVGDRLNHSIRKISPAPPTVTSFTATTGYPGLGIVINGTNFIGVTQVQFGGVNSPSFTVISPTQLVAAVPAGGASGSVSVTNAGGTGSLAGFTFTGTVPQVSTVAGNAAGAGFADGQNGAARLNGPWGGIKIGGDIYFTEYSGHRVRKYNIATGNVTTLAGSGVAGYLDATGTAAQFNNPQGLTRDAAGDLYVADGGNHRIRKITVATGVVTTFAGSGTAGWNDATGTAAQFNNPHGLEWDGAGNIFVADRVNHRIRRIVIATGVVTTLAGSGAASFADGTGAAAQFNLPTGVSSDGSGNLYVADQGNHRIRRIVIATGVVTTAAGNGTTGLLDGVGTGAQFFNPSAVAWVNGGVGGLLYIADLSNHAIRLMDIGMSNTVNTYSGTNVAGNVDGTLTAARYNNPTGIVYDASAVFYVFDQLNNSIRRVSPAPPTVTSFTPTSAYPMQVVTVNGTNLTGASQMQFGGVNAAWYNVVSATQIQAVVPFGAAAGNVSVTTPAGAASLAGFTVAAAPQVSTLAGNGTAGYVDAAGQAAQFRPDGIVADALGNIYVGDALNHRIRKISPTGVVTTFAGSGVAGFADGTGTAAQFNNPVGVALDGAGNVYVADANNHRIRKITAAGVVTTLAGSGTAGFNDALGTLAQFSTPHDLEVDGAGNVFVADWYNHRIRKITPAGLVTTFAGSGVAGFADATGVAAQFNEPTGVALDASGNIYVSDLVNHRIRKITSGGVVTTLAGSGVAGFNDAVGTAAQFNQPTFVAVDVSGNVYVTDYGNNRYRLITPSGTVSTLAGTGVAGYVDGSTALSQFSMPAGITVNASGNIYVADLGNNAIRKITLSPSTVTGFLPTSAYPMQVVTVNGTNFTGASQVQFGGVNAAWYNVVSATQIQAVVPFGAAAGNVSVTTPAGAASQAGFTVAAVPQVSTFAGDGTAGFLDAAGQLAQFNFPRSIARDASGNVYVAEFSNHRIRKISSTGVVTTFAGSGVAGFADGTGTGAQFNQPGGVAVDALGNVYVADANNHRIRKITSLGVVTTLAGNGSAGFADGAGASAQFNLPFGIAVDASGNVYVGDASNHRIRKITSLGFVSTLAGSGAAGFADGTGAAAQFNNPGGVTLDAAGNVFISDYLNHRIRKVTSVGVVTTLAGSGTAGFADGLGTSAQFNFPVGITLDAAGNLYIADYLNQRIRIVSALGAVSTLAGSGVTGFADGVYASAQFNNPYGVVVDAVGNVFVAEQNGNRIRKITLTPATVTSFTPTSAYPMQVVTVNGTNFTGASQVQFGGVNAASFTVVSPTQITAVVATGASGIVSVTTPNGTGSLAGFTVVPIAVTSFTPVNAGPGTTVTITGTAFTGATQVQFGGVNAASFTVVSATQITAVVPAGGVSGSVSVTTPAGTASQAGFTFMPNLFYFTGGDAGVRTNWNSVLGGGGVNPLAVQFMNNTGDSYIFPTTVPTGNVITPLTIGNGVSVTQQANTTLLVTSALSIAAGGTMTVQPIANIVLSGSALSNAGTFTMQGSLVVVDNATYSGVSPVYSGASATLAYNGIGNRTTGTEFPPTLSGNLVLDKAGQTLTLDANRIVQGTTQPINGTLALSNFTLTANGNLDLTGAAVVSGGASAGLVVGGAGTITGNLLVAAPASFGAGLTMNRGGVTLTLGGVGLTATPLNLQSGTIITGALNHTFTAPLSISASGFLNISAGGTTTFASNATNGGNITINGTLDAGVTVQSGTGGLTINPTGTFITAHPGGLGGALLNSGGIAYNGTVRIQGASVGNSLGLNVNNLIIDRPTAVTLPQNLNVGGVLTIANAGNFDLSGRTLTLTASASTATSATGTIDASGAASILATSAPALNGAHFTGGVVRTLNVNAVPTLTNSLAITGTLNMFLDVTLGAPNARLWLRNGATLNALGTRIQGTNTTSEVILENGFNGGTIAGGAFAPLYNGAINVGGAFNLTGTLTMSAAAGALALNGNLTLQAATTLVLNQTAANALTGTALLQGSGASSGIVLGAGFNANILPANFFAPTLNANVTTPGGTSTLSGGALTLGAAQTLTLGGRVTTSLANLIRVTNTATGAIVGASATNYIDGPLERQLLGGIGADGTSYFLPIGEGTSYRPMNLLNIRSGASPLVRGTVFPSGATTPDNITILTLLSGRNWQLETLSGGFTSTTLELTEGGLLPTDLVGISSAQSGSYASVGGNPGAGFVRSNAQAALGNRFYSIAGTPPTIFYYNEALLGDASLASSWNSAANGSGVPATPALMTAGSGVAFIVRSGITATATTGVTFGSGVSLTLQPTSTLILQSGTLTVNGTANISGVLAIGNGATLANAGTTTIAANGTLRLAGTGAVSGNAPVYAASTSALEYTGTSSKTVGSEWLLAAPYTIRIANSGGVSLAANRTLSNTANLMVQPGGILTLASGVTLTNNGSILVQSLSKVALDGNAQFGGASGVSYLSTATLEFTNADPAPNPNAGGKAFPAAMSANVVVNNSITLTESKTVDGAWTGGSGANAVTMGANTLTLNGAIDFGGISFQTTAASGFVIGGSGAISGAVALPGGQLSTLTLNRTGSVLALATPVAVANTLTLTGGIISTTTGILTLSNPAVSSLVGGSATSYVQGALVRALNANLSADPAQYLFPVAKGGIYFPFTLSNLTTGATPPQVRVEAFNAGAAGTLAGGVTGSVSLTEHWQTQVLSGNYSSGAATLTRGSLTGASRVGFAVNPTTIFQNAAGTVSGNTIQSSVVSGLGTFAVLFPSSMQIADFTPKIGAAGTTITITGTGFISPATVLVGGIPAVAVNVVSPTQITAQLTAAGATGQIEVSALFVQPFPMPPQVQTTRSDSAFTFLAAPTILGFTPSGGSVGTTVNIAGTNFTGATQVRFNGVPATSYTVGSALNIIATVPAGGFGLIEVVTPGGTAVSATGFTNIPVPTISSFTPTQGGVGAFITINGTGFTGATAVRFGGELAVSFTVNSPTRITAVVGVFGASGKVTVVTPGGTATSANDFTYGTPPSIVTLTPNAAAPGTWVRATGLNLDGLLFVLASGIQADSARQISSSMIEFKMPLTLAVPFGQDSITIPIRAKVASGDATQSMKLLAAPSVTQIQPDSGRVGDTVRIIGKALTSVGRVTFAGIPAVFTSVSPTEIRSVVPTGTPFNTQFVVVNARGADAAPARWLHIPPRPTLTAQSLDSGEVGTTLTLTGTNFFSDSRVFFNGLEAASTIINSTTSITAVVPRGASTGFITLTTEYGSARVPRTFTVLLPQPRITAFSPNRGGVGTLVRLTGIRFDSTALFSFGGVAAQTFLGSTTDAVAVIPTGVALGEVAVGVRTNLGSSEASQLFTVLPAPLLTNIDPISEGAGERITLSGRNFIGVTSLTVGATPVVNFMVVSDTLITFTADGLPAGMGVVTAFSPGGQGSYFAPFEVLPPSVANAPRNIAFEPSFGPAGTRVRVTGRNLGGIVAAKIGGVSVAAIEQVSTTEIIVVLGRGATGAIVLTNGFGTGGSRTPFRFQTPLDLDSLALLAFYEAHRSENAVLPRLWKTTARIVNWEGVSVQSISSGGFVDERIVGVNLDSKALNGSMTSGRLRLADIARLTELRVLNLSNNRLSGDIAGQLIPFRQLRELRLAGNRLTGELARAFGVQEEIPTPLEVIDLRNNALSGSVPPALFDLPNIREIYLSENSFTGALRLGEGTLQKAALTQSALTLERLEVGNNQLSGAIPPTIGNFAGLVSVRFDRNRFEGTIPSRIGECVNLKMLDLSENQLSGAVPTELRNNARLESLLLNDNRLTFVPDLSLRRRRLKTLAVQNNRLDFASLEFNMVLDTVRYIPQDTLDVAQRSITGIVGLPLRIPITVGGTANRAQWEVNRGPSSGASSTIIGGLPAAFRYADTGTYICKFTNARVPGLTLVSRPVQVSGRLPNPPVSSPVLLLPAQNATNLPTEVPLEWSEVADAAVYELQVSRTADLSSPIFTLQVNTTGTITQELVNLTRFFWRVRAINAGGIGPWSSVQSFVTVRSGAIVSAFAEISPKTPIGDVNFGQLFLRNLTAQAIRIDSLRLVEAENSFETRTAFRSLTLEAREQRTVVIAFAPKSVGRKIGNLEAVYTVLSTQTQERDTFARAFSGAATALKALPVDFDTVIAGKATILQAILINRGRSALPVSSVQFANSTNGLVSGAFMFQGTGNKPLREPLIKRGNEITLPSGDSLTVIIRAEPQKIGLEETRLLWATTGEGADTVEAPVTAFVKPPEPADVIVRLGVRAVDTDGKPIQKAVPGALVMLEMYIAEGNVDSLFRITQPEFTATIRYDKNVLNLASEGAARLLRGDAARRLQRIIVPTTRWSGRGRRLALIPMRAVAGDTTETAVEIESSLWGGASSGGRVFWERRVFVIAPEGAVFATEVSQAGGKRLITSVQPSLRLVTIAPNPTKEQIEVAYTLPESDLITLTLLDARGNEVQHLVSEMQSAGEHKANFKLTSIPSGAYVLRISSSKEMVAGRVEIVR